MKKRSITLITAILLALVAGLYFWTISRSSEDNEDGSSDLNGGEPQTVTLETVKADMEKYDTDSQIDLKTRTYQNKKYGFSINVPESMTVSNFQEGRVGEVILFQVNEKKDKNDDPWMQVFVLPFDEEGLITPERIKKDLPDMEVEDPKYAIIGKEKFKALIFMSNEPGIGKTREVWFVKNGYLFQINTGHEYERLLGEMLETIEFR